jgi:oxygen-independent coproporphyrinogen-3 oxidase
MSPSPHPEGDVAPRDGELPPSAALGADQRDFGLYIHVPFCAHRCGYCDFNTYTAEEHRGVSRDSYPEHAKAEMALAARVMKDTGIAPRKLSTVFFGGGTPTLLGPRPLLELLQQARDTWGVVDGADVTVEANPDSVTGEELQALADGGVTRVSFGVQSANTSVLAVLDRTHDPEVVPLRIREAREAGLAVSLDLIYGSPGETLEMWEETLSFAVALAPDHLSAYALIVEPGTALARRISRGELAHPDDDTHADMYLATESLLSAAGYSWYEISNWARDPDQESQHNRNYWNSSDWWGIGPGAHSHVGGVRWWNVKHPAAYADRVGAGQSPAHSREILTAHDQAVERVLLGIRMREGISRDDVAEGTSAFIAQAIGSGLLEGKAALTGRLVLTLRGRLVADYLARELT